MTKLRLSSMVKTAVTSQPKPNQPPKLEALLSSKTRSSPNHNLQKTSSSVVSEFIDNLNSKSHAPVGSFIPFPSPITSSLAKSLDLAPILSELNSTESENAVEDPQTSPLSSLFPDKAMSRRKKETARWRKEKWISKSSSGNSFGFGRLINMCGQNLGTCTAVDIFRKLGRRGAVEDYSKFIKICLENVRKSDDEDFIGEQISVLYKLLKLMKEYDFPLNEGTYGPLLLYFIGMSMEEEIHFFLDVIKDKNDAALPRLGYYEMSLYIRVNKEEKIQELCHYISTNDSDEIAEMRENYVSALCDADRKSDLLQLFEVIDVTEISSENNLASIFRSLGRLSLESYAERFLLALKDHDNGADTISKHIFNYAISAPNLAVEDVVSKFKNMHLLLEMEPHLKSYEEMVVYCCEVQEINVALDVVHQMCEEGLTISEGTLNSILHSIEDNFEFHLVRRVYSLIHEKDLKPTEATLKMLISFCVRMKQFDSAYALLDELKKFNLEPTASMYNVIMAGYFREKNPCAARKVFNQMKLAGVQPDSQTYFYLISNCNCEKKINEYNEEMKQAEIGMTKYAFMALISAYASCGQFEKAKEVILDTSISASNLNEIKSVLVHTLASHGQLRDALNIYNEMKEAGLDVMPKATLSIIEYGRSELDLNGLLKLLEEVQNSDYWASCCSRVLSYCLHNKHLSPAVDLLKQLVDKFKDNELAVEVLFDETFARFAEMESPDLQFAMSLLEAIEKNISVSPSRKCLDFLMTASIKVKDVRHSHLIWKKYKQKGLPYNIMSFLGRYLALLAGGEHESAKTILSKIPTGDPDVRSIIEACQRTYPEPGIPEKVIERKKRKKKKKTKG